MAQLEPDFRHDVFVSYSHGDVDASGNSPLKCWSQALARELEAELRTTPGFQRSAVFLDESARSEQGLSTNDPLTAQLRAASGGAAFLLVLMSPHYLNSTWCSDERRWWLEEAAKQAFPEIGSRFFVARIWPTADADWPKELCDEQANPVIGTWFHERPGDPLRSRPFDWPMPERARGAFTDALVALVGQIAVRMKSLEEALQRKRKAAEGVAKLSAESGQLLYVHARARDEPRWSAARAELIAAGYAVLPGGPEPESDDPSHLASTEGMILRTLSACDGLLLVPTDNLQALVSDLAVVGYQWRKSARAIRNNPLPCAVVDSGLTLPVKRTLQQSAKSLRIDWIEAATGGWATQVKEWLNTAGAKAAT
jgi:hypothetical protein